MKGITIGYYAAHEQFNPGELLRLVQLAEKAGFKGALCADHFSPWSESQIESGFDLSWLGAAMQATNLRFGLVNTSSQRYHPSVIAQAAATLCQMFPLGFWIAVGNGQFMNEPVTGQRWLSETERTQHLLESVQIIRSLWRGELVTHKDQTEVYNAKLGTLPNYIPNLMGAAVTESAAECAGRWADGLITTSRPYDQLKRIIDAFRKGGGEGKPVYLKVQLSYDKSYAKALAGAQQQWNSNMLLSGEREDGNNFSAIRVSGSLDQHAEWLWQDVEAGVSNLYLHNVNTEQQQFIEDFGRKVLPNFHSSWLDE